MLGLRTYNYEHFTQEVLRGAEHAAFSGPGPGERAPDFKAPALDGESHRLSDYRGKKNVLLVFGSATCPTTATSVPGLNRLYDQLRGGDIEFLFVYTREAHPGERLPAHGSMSQKANAAKILRDEEDLRMPVLIDDVHGSIHKKYSKLPNAAFLIDKSGRVAFRSLWARPETLAAAIQELLQLQREQGVDHAVVGDGEDMNLPASYNALYAYRALERGGHQSVHDFRVALGLASHTATPSGKSKPLLQRPGRVLAISALTAVVLAGGMYAGFELRKRRLGVRRNPYRAYEKEEVRDTDTGTDYGAVGI
jgi:alkyl hydroperoxide reductase subunit AhpC